MIPLGDDAPSVQCSAAGCRAPAVWTLAWRNPRIHPVDRVKTWLACDEHRASLAGFLETRGFPLTVSARVDERVDEAAESTR